MTAIPICKTIINTSSLSAIPITLRILGLMKQGCVLDRVPVKGDWALSNVSNYLVLY